LRKSIRIRIFLISVYHYSKTLKTIICISCNEFISHI